MRFLLVVLYLVHSAVGQTLPVSPAVPTFSPPAQVGAAPPAKAPGPADVAQLALDEHLYFALKLSMDVAGTQLRPEQRDYFNGILAFHEGRFEEARKQLSAALNAHDSALTSGQKIEAFQTLGRNARITGEFGGCAQMFEDIDKIWGARLGDAERGVRDNRHFCVAQMGNAPQTVDFTTPFTIRRTQGTYPVKVGKIAGMVQLDTGADETVLTESTAKDWGVAPSEAAVVLHGYSGAEFKGHPGVIPSLSIGTATLHNVPVLIVPDANLFIAPLHLQTQALLGLPILEALGRLTFLRDGSLTATPSSAAPSPAPSPDAGAPLWLGDSQLLVEAGTLVGTQGFRFGGTHEPRLFVLDTGSGSSYLTDHYFKEHPEQFPGPPPETAKLTGAGGELDLPAYAAHHLPLWFGSSSIELSGQHVLQTFLSSGIESTEGLLGQDVLSALTSYTIDLRLMRFTVQP